MTPDEWRYHVLQKLDRIIELLEANERRQQQGVIVWKPNAHLDGEYRVEMPQETGEAP